MRSPFALLTTVALTLIAPAALAEAPRPDTPPSGVDAPSRPRTLPYGEDQPTPYGYRPVSRYRYGLIIGGALTFSTLYIPTVVATAGTSDKITYVPIAGPFILAGKVGARSGDLFTPLSIFFLAVDGLGQAAGAAMLISGLAHKKQVLVRDDVAAVRVTPMILGYGAAGIGIIGTM